MSLLCTLDSCKCCDTSRISEFTHYRLLKRHSANRSASINDGLRALQDFEFHPFDIGLDEGDRSGRKDLVDCGGDVRIRRDVVAICGELGRSEIANLGGIDC